MYCHADRDHSLGFVWQVHLYFTILVWHFWLEMGTKKPLRYFVKTLRWIARIWGSLLALGAILYIDQYFGGFISGEVVFYPDTLERLFFPYVSAIGFIIAWKREGLGGIIAIGGFVGTLIIDPSVSTQELLGGLFYIIPGFIFLSCWLFSRRMHQD